MLENLAAEPSGSQPTNVAEVDTRNGDCDTVLNELLDKHERANEKFGPALAFLDQFGYGSVSMDLVRRILRYPHCEVFSYLEYREINRFITDKNKWPAFTKAFGTDDWKQFIDSPLQERRTGLLELYKTALRDVGRARHVQSFAMYSQQEAAPLCWLFFCTNHLRGLEEMKKAMWSVDKSGRFRFSDQDDPTQMKLLNDAYDDDWLADELAVRLAGKRMTIAEIYEFVLTQTPCYKFKTALGELESRETGGITVVSAPAGRKPKAFKQDTIAVQFSTTVPSRQGRLI